MKLPDYLRERLVFEFRLAESKMGEAKSANEVLYVFSVLFGESVRVLNWHWDKELALVWMVAQQTHRAFAARMQAVSQGDRVVMLSDDFFDALKNETGALADWIEKQGDEGELCRILARFAELSYATTGNGFYLLSKGHLEL